MVFSTLLTLALGALSCIPGLLLTRAFAAAPGLRAAAACASFVVCLLVTALIGAAWAALNRGDLPAVAMAPVALVLTAGALLSRRGRLSAGGFEWQGWAYAAAMVAYGLLAMWLAIRLTPDGSLSIHSYYNADGFKHLGHVHALANFGVPARDLFGSAEPLHYYWLFYILPGAGTLLGGNAWAALCAANVFVCTLFALTFYGVVRMTGASANQSLVAVLLGTLVSAPLTHTGALFGAASFAEVLDMSEAPEPALLMIPQVIPQHALVLTLLLGWAIVTHHASSDRALRLLSLAALSASLVISTLLGAMCLLAYGLLTIWSRGMRAAPQPALVGAVAGLLLLVLGVLPESAAAGNAGPVAEDAWYVRSLSGVLRLAGMVGAPLLVTAFLLRYWRADGPAVHAKRLAICLAVAAFGMVIVTQALLPQRIAIEFLIRARLMVAIALAIAGGWFIAVFYSRDLKARRTVVLVLAALALPALAAFTIRTAWLGNHGDRFTTTIPAADLAALSTLRKASEPRAMVWQYPERPKAASPSGDDVWSVAIAGRAVPHSSRSTNKSITTPYAAQLRRFFAGDDEALPSMVDWVYLSRKLHPQSYDALLAAMRGKAGWHEEACYREACLFSR